MLPIVKNILLLFKNFINFFKKNTMQLVALLFLVIIMVAISFGSFISSMDIQAQISLINAHTNFSSFTYSDLMKKEYDYNHPRYDNNFLKHSAFYYHYLANAGLDHNLTQIDRTYHSFYPIEMSQQFNENDSYFMPFNWEKSVEKTGFQVWKTTPEMIDQYNNSHTDSEPINYNDSLYALIIKNNNTKQVASENDLQLGKTSNILDKDQSDGLMHFDLSKWNKDLKNVSVILFNDILNYFDNTAMAQYLSSVDNPKKLYLVSYGSDFFSNFAQPNVPNIKIRSDDIWDQQQKKFIPQWHTCTPDSTDPICNQKKTYTNNVTSIIYPKRPLSKNTSANELSLNNYVSAIERIMIDTATGSMFVNNKFKTYAEATDIENESQIIYFPGNDGLKPDWVKSGYKPDGQTLYHLAKNQVLISHSYAISKKLKIGQTINLYGIGKYQIAGFTIDRTLSDVLGLTVNSSGYGVWLNPKEYERLFLSGMVLPPQTSIFRQETGDVYFSRSLNPNLPAIQRKQLANVVKTVKSIIYFQDEPNSHYLGNVYFAAETRLSIITSLILTSTLLLFISSLVLSFIIVSKIIKSNMKVIGTLKALGFRTRYMVTTFIMVFFVVFFAANVIGESLAYALSYFLNTSYQFGIDLFSYSTHFYLIPSIFVFFIVPIVMSILVWILTFLLCYRGSLDLMRQKDRKKFQFNIISVNIFKNISFKHKIAYRFASTAKVKLGLTLFIAIIASAIFYSTITSTALFSQSQIILNDLDFAYMDQFRKTINHQVNDLRLSPDQDTMTTKDFASNEVIKTDPNYMQIKVQYDKDGKPIVDEDLIAKLSMSFKNSWIYASDIRNTYNYCKVDHIEECKKAFSKHPQVLPFMEGMYEQNEYYINLLDRNNGIITLGFQAYSDSEVNHGFQALLTGNLYKDNVDLVSYLSQNDVYPSRQIQLKEIGIKDYYDNNIHQPHNIYIRGLNINPTALLKAKNQNDIIKNLSWNLQGKVDKILKAVKSFNDSAAGKVVYHVNVMPLVLNSLKARNCSLKTNDIILTDFRKIDNIQHDLNVTVVVGTTRSMNQDYSFTNYSALSRYVIDWLGYNGNDSANQNINPINYDFSSDPTSAAKKYLGVYLTNDDYHPRDYGPNHIPKYQVYLTRLISKTVISNVLNSIIQIIFIVMLIISLIMVVACIVQTGVTSNMILKDNINTINLLRCLGYRSMWIFNRLFTIYVPAILISIFISMPIGIVISNNMFEIFIKATNIIYSTSISYFTAFICLVIIFALFSISFAVTWNHIKRAYPIYRFIG